MLLIDSLHINIGGGKVLLDYLVSELEKKDIKAFYLFDERCANDFGEIPNERKIFLKSSLWNRYQFYKKNKSNFSRVFCFGNLPPYIKLKVPVFTYFHQPMFIDIPKEYNLKDKILFSLKTQFFRFFLSNTDYLLVQNEFIRDAVHKKFKLNKKHVLLCPFYPDKDLFINNDVNRKSNSFLYSSSGASHKNHMRLLDAFVAFYNRNKTGELIITVGDEYITLQDKIKQLVKKGYPIKNIGFVHRKELINYYQQSEYLFFPSLRESFGLGIVESIECGCKVIGADLPYMYQVCQPSITFDPYDVDAIAIAFEKAIHKEETKTEQLISNKIEELIKLLNQ